MRMILDKFISTLKLLRNHILLRENGNGKILLYIHTHVIGSIM